MENIKKYTVIILLNNDGSKVLLQTKDRTAFAGMLNGTGGKIEDQESPIEGAFRELLEETSLQPKDLEHFEWLGTLTLPEQCDDQNPDKLPELWFFGGVVKDESLAHKPENETEPISWYMLDSDSRPITDMQTAGDGNLEYFIDRTRRILFHGEAASYEAEDAL